MTRERVYVVGVETNGKNASFSGSRYLLPILINFAQQPVPNGVCDLRSPPQKGPKEEIPTCLKSYVGLTLLGGCKNNLHLSFLSSDANTSFLK